MKYAVVTFGCRVNQADSMALERDLRAGGGEPAPAADADLVLVNSCSVTASADQGTRQTIRRIARDNPRARIVVTGCYATRRPDEVASLPGVVRVVPNPAKDDLVSSLDGFTTTAARYAGGEGPCGAPLLDRTAFTLRVQTGCEERCSYCVIPQTRGASRSRPVEDVLRELSWAGDAGYREVTLTGVHLGSYGRDLRPRRSLVDLLLAVASAGGRARIRLGSLEPMDCPRALVDLAVAGALAPAFHLPLQHASDRVLARMRRPYTLAFYRDLVDDIRRRLPHASLTADVIVGFPGEREDDFEQLAGYLAASPLTQLHVFPYSERPGTEAAAFGDRVPGPVVRDRARQVREIGQALAAGFRRSQRGRVCDALTVADGSTAVLDNGLKVKIDSGMRRNERVRLRIEGETASVM